MQKAGFFRGTLSGGDPHPREESASGRGPGQAAGSVQEAPAGLLPAAGPAPEVPALHAIHLPALLGIPSGLPRGGTKLGGQGWRAGPDCGRPWLQVGGCQAALVGVVTVAHLGGCRGAEHRGWGQGQRAQQAGQGGGLRQRQAGEGGWHTGAG